MNKNIDYSDGFWTLFDTEPEYFKTLSTDELCNRLENVAEELLMTDHLYDDIPDLIKEAIRRIKNTGGTGDE